MDAGRFATISQRHSQSRSSVHRPPVRTDPEVPSQGSGTTWPESTRRDLRSEERHPSPHADRCHSGGRQAVRLGSVGRGQLGAQSARRRPSDDHRTRRSGGGYGDGARRAAASRVLPRHPCAVRPTHPVRFGLRSLARRRRPEPSGRCRPGPTSLRAPPDSVRRSPRIYLRAHAGGRSSGRLRVARRPGVYCLGYGENDILDRRITEPPNAGTPQFWRIFVSCVDGSPQSADFRATLGSSVPSHVRVANKLALLGRLRDAGVWLLDASPAALSGPGGPKASPRTIDQAIDLGYELHVRHAIEAAAPSEIICVGKGVGDVLATRLRRTGATITVVSQPNARLTTAEHDLALATYRDVVRRGTGIQHERATPC